MNAVNSFLIIRFCILVFNDIAKIVVFLLIIDFFAVFFKICNILCHFMIQTMIRFSIIVRNFVTDFRKYKRLTFG